MSIFCAQSACATILVATSAGTPMACRALDSQPAVSAGISATGTDVAAVDAACAAALCGRENKTPGSNIKIIRAREMIFFTSFFIVITCLYYTVQPSITQFFGDSYGQIIQARFQFEGIFLIFAYTSEGHNSIALIELDILQIFRQS